MFVLETQFCTLVEYCSQIQHCRVCVCVYQNNNNKGRILQPHTGDQQDMLEVCCERLSLGEFGNTSGNSVTLSIVKSGKSDDSMSFCSGIHTVPPSSASFPP